MAHSIVSHGVKETQSYISTVSLFPDGQPFQPIELVMTPNLDDKEITQDNKPLVTLHHMCWCLLVNQITKSSSIFAVLEKDGEFFLFKSLFFINLIHDTFIIENLASFIPSFII